MHIDISDDERPLCPNIGWPGNPAHELRTRVLNAFYNAAEKDAEGEMTGTAEAAYSEAAYGSGTDERMHLYREGVAALYGGSYVTVEAWWFKCPICGFVLPANRIERGR
jgi:hypothetical protein